MLPNAFVIIGYQPSRAVRTPLANIKIASFDGQRLRYAGAGGTGFSEAAAAAAAALRTRLDRIRIERSAVAGLKFGGAVWVSPNLRAPVAYRRRYNGRRTAAHQFQGAGGVERSI